MTAWAVKEIDIDNSDHMRQGIDGNGRQRSQPAVPFGAFYDVTVEDHDVRRIHVVQAKREGHDPAAGTNADVAVSALVNSDGIARDALGRPIGFWRALWRALVRMLVALGFDETPRVIAVIKAPDRMYCAYCGTVRVAKYCPACGANVDQQYRKMVRQMAQYVVDGTSERRESLEQALAEEVEQRVSAIAEEQRNQIAQKLAALERTYVMEIARHRKQLQSLLAGMMPLPANPARWLAADPQQPPAASAPPPVDHAGPPSADGPPQPVR